MRNEKGKRENIIEVKEDIMIELRGKERGGKEMKMIETFMHCYGANYSFLLCEVMVKRIKEVQKLGLVKGVKNDKLLGYFNDVVGARKRTDNQRKVVKEIKLILKGTPEQPIESSEIDLDLFYKKVIELIEYTSNEIELMYEAGLNIIDKELPDGSDELKEIVNHYKDMERRDFIKVYNRYDKLNNWHYKNLR